MRLTHKFEYNNVFTVKMRMKTQMRTVIDYLNIYNYVVIIRILEGYC